MARKILFLTLTALLLLLVLEIWHHHQLLQEERNKLTATLQQLEEVKQSLEEKQREVELLTTRLNSPAPSAEIPQKAPAATPTASHDSTEVPRMQLAEQNRRLMVEGRVNAMQKMIDLNENQIERLRSKYELEMSGLQSAESLDDIVGSENAEFYRQQKRSSFERAQAESIEKEVLYISRQLQMDERQEQALRQIYGAVEQEVQAKMKELFSQPQQGLSGRQLALNKMLTESQLRDSLLAERLKEILDKKQYSDYVKLQAQSSDQDMQLWHGP